MTRLFLFAVLMGLVGCVSDGNRSTGFASGEASIDPEVPTDDDDDPTDDVVTDDDDDTSDPASPLEWDASAPDDPEDGWLFEGTLVCGLLDGAAAKEWELREGTWDELPTPNPTRLLAGIELCAQDSPKYLRWNDDDSLYIEAAGMGHWLEPTGTEGLWAGTVEPLGEITPECHAALADHGLSWPVTLTLRLDALTSPDEAPPS
jgi:hypothetical protein